MNTEILENLGLTGAEIKVFLSSLELGPSSAGPIVQRSELQNAVVHRALHSLIEKGLITYILEGKKKIYSTIPPKLLLSHLDEKREQLQSLIPELEAKQNLAPSQPKASIFQGKRGIKELLTLMLDTDSKEYFAYGGPKIAQDLLGEHFWESFHRTRSRKKIKAQLLFHSSLKLWGQFLNRKFPKYTTLKYTNKDFEEITETIICGNRICIIVYLDKPIGFLLASPEATNSYTKFFNILWNQSK
jgi:sugar-specific transcriptional regulator TrmB